MAHLNYKHLQYFWAVAHEGNLTRAAEKMHVSQSALSIQIQKLEEQLGHALFERRGRQLVLTEAGSVVLDHADQIFNTGEELLVALRDRVSGAASLLRVGARSNLSRNFQMKFLAPVLARDDVRLLLTSGSFTDLIKDLETHKIDVVLSNILPIRDGNATWVPHLIDEQGISLIATPELAEKWQDRDEAIAGAPLVLPTVDSGVRVGFDSLIETRKWAPKIVAESDDMALLRLLIRGGVGIGVVPPIVVEHELSSGKLVEIDTVPGLTETFFAITLSRLFPNMVLQDLL